MTILLAIEKLASQDAKTLKGVLTTMKQELKVVAIMLAMTLVLLCGVAVGTANGGITVNINGGVGGGSSAVGGGASSSSPVGNQQSMADAEEKELGQTSSGLEMPQDGDAVNITKAFNKAINDYRAYTGVVTLHRVEDTQVNITKLPAAAKALEGVINDVIKSIVKPVDETFTFENGVDKNDPARLIGHKMIPNNRDAAVTPSDISACKIVENSDGGYTITLTFLAETATFDGTNSTEPVHHMTAMDPLNLGTLDVSPLEIFSAEMTYPGATTSVTVDSQGRLIQVKNSLPLEGLGNGGMGFIKAEIGLAGKMEAVYDITYA